MGALATLVFAVLFAFHPETGLRVSGHTVENLLTVMADRYLTFSLFLVAAAISGQAVVLAVTLAILTVPSAVDTVIYARAGLPYQSHLIAALVTASLSVLALLAMLQRR